MEDAVTEAPGVFVIQLEGDFDLSERERLTDAFAVASSALIVAVNLSRATYIDSSVLECLLALHFATQKRGARLILAGVRGSVLRLFQITELYKLFDLQGGLSDAAGSGEEVRRLTLVARPIPTD
jgi:stage II sporulation protein AA (anti-sigma F factor antagonist)